MINNLRLKILRNRTTSGLVILLLLLFIVSFWGYKNFIDSSNAKTLEETDLVFNTEGPYALLIPRRDGNAVILNLKRTSSYDEISYELSYTAAPDQNTIAGKKTEEGEDSGESIDRGVIGAIDTKSKKGEYDQEILFGTCSKNVCKYDKGIENGTLTLHIKKGNKAFRMITQWHLQQLDIDLGVLTSGDAHFTYTIEGKDEVLTETGYTIVNDLTGLPKLPGGREVLGKAYALNIPLARKISSGNVSIELSQNAPMEAKISRFDEVNNKWIEIDTRVENSKLTAKTDGSGIFAVLVPKN